PAQALMMRRKALRSFIASVAIGAILLGDVGFIFVGFSEPLVWACQAAGAGALIVALLCNRRGWVALAALLAVFGALAAVWPTIWFYERGLTVDAWPAFDLLVLGPVVLVAVFERQRWAWVLAALTLVMIGLTVYWQPWASDMRLEAATLGGDVATYGVLLSRPFFLYVLAVFIVRTSMAATNREIGRADLESRARASETARADFLAGNNEEMMKFVKELIDVDTNRSRFPGNVPPYAHVEAAYRDYLEVTAQQRHRGRVPPEAQRRLASALN